MLVPLRDTDDRSGIEPDISDDDYQPEAWEMQAEETMQSYNAFTIYRGMGMRRSLRSAAARYYGSDDRTTPDQAEQKGASRAQVVQFERWSSHYRWSARCAAYHLHLDSLRRVETEAAIIEMAERHAKLALLMLSRSAEALNNLDPADLSPREMAVLAAEAVKIERLSRGQPTERVSSEHREHRVIEEYREVVMTNPAVALQARNLALALEQAGVKVDVDD